MINSLCLPKSLLSITLIIIEETTKSSEIQVTILVKHKSLLTHSCKFIERVILKKCFSKVDKRAARRSTEQKLHSTQTQSFAPNRPYLHLKRVKDQKRDNIQSQVKDGTLPTAVMICTLPNRTEKCLLNLKVKPLMSILILRRMNLFLKETTHRSAGKL